MRMAGPDIVLFIVGALLFLGAAGAVYQQGGIGGVTEQTSALGVFDVSFTTADKELASAAVSSFRSVDQTLEVTEGNTTTIQLRIACTDSAASNVAAFNMQVELTGPNGLSGSGSGACGSAVTIDVAVAIAPPATRVPGDTETEARESYEAIEFANATRGIGTWTVKVSGVRTGAASNLPGQVVQDPSGTITLVGKVWEPRFTPVALR